MEKVDETYGERLLRLFELLSNLEEDMEDTHNFTDAEREESRVEYERNLKEIEELGVKSQYTEYKRRKLLITEHK